MNVRNFEDLQSPSERQSQMVEPERSKPPIVKKREPSLEACVYFTDLGLDKNEKNKTKCKACGTELVGGGTRYETSSFKRHVQNCKQIKAKYHNIGV